MREPIMDRSAPDAPPLADRENRAANAAAKLPQRPVNNNEAVGFASRYATG